MMRRILELCSAVLLSLLAQGAVTHAQSSDPPDSTPKVQARLVIEHAAIAPGGTTAIALHETIREGWHTYWRNPGDSGAPTSIVWHLPEGWMVSPISWPYPKRLPVGPLMNFGYEQEVSLLMTVTAPPDTPVGQTTRLTADASWLVCSDICIPEEAVLTLDVPVAPELGAPVPGRAQMFTAAREKLPHASPWPARFSADGGQFGLFVESAELSAARPRQAQFFPYTDGYVENAAPQTMRVAGGGIVLQSAPGWRLTKADDPARDGPLEGVLVITGADGRTDALEILATPGAVPMMSEAGLGIAAALAFAFLGGIILNLMPCVLPVLSMKALALARTSMPARGEAFAYGAGVLVCFLGLAAFLLVLRAGGAAVGWGFQLQQPIVVAFLALLLFAVGLNLSGVFRIGGGRLAGAGQTLAARHGVAGSFFTGVLAAGVATPCTAPFMAAALGYALVQPAIVALAVFLAVGIGFALPFTLLGLSPALQRLLPRPGPWMEMLRQILAFPMYGAAIWLVWVLSQQTGPQGLLAVLSAALALAFALWVTDATSRGASRPRVLAIAVATIAVGATLVLVLQVRAEATQTAAQPGALGYVPYAPEALEQARASGQPVFVNITAAWCITCLVNERVALSSARLTKAFADANVLAMKGDWTNRDPSITALLEEYGRSGVPLYLYFPTGGRPAVILPQILTEARLLEVVDQ